MTTIRLHPQPASAQAECVPPPGVLPAPPAKDERLAPVVFSTQGVEPRHRIDLWRSTYESFNRLQPLGPTGQEFEACNEIWSFGRLALLRNSAPGMTFERTLRHIRRDSVDHWAIRLTRTGHARMRIGEASFATGPGQLMLFSLGQPMEGERSEADWLSLYIPRDSFPDLSAGLSRLGTCVLETPGSALLADFIRMLVRRMPHTNRAEVPILAEATRGMVAACLLGAVTPRAVAPADTELTRLERIRCVVRQHLGSPTLGPEKLCRLAGVSRSQLYRLFEPHGGVARYIQAQRLRMAHAMLADPGCRESIAAIAERVGHFDASAFSRAFRQEFGCTPSEVRLAALAGGLPPDGREGRYPEAPADFVSLMRHLGAAGEPRESAA